MVKLVTSFVAVSLFGCGLQSQRARDATLPYHPTLDTLRSAPSKPPARAGQKTRAVTAQLELEGFARGYPSPIGLTYSHDGGMRAIIGVQTEDQPFEDMLGARLVQRIQSGAGAPLSIGGGVVQLAQYRFGDSVYVSTIVEVRAVRDGTEVYAARFTSAAKGGDGAMLRQMVADDVVDQIVADDQLFATMEGAPQ
jgi:hypothetical protein